ncbi:MAG: hypothetical protein JST01_03410 [Cyanobacteria bacterium SZAS TMP-1]|nr:hypothetical protein [Cyanobacteria bacterium SZAS TMP-1]
MNTNIIRNSDNNGMNSSVDAELGIDVGATYKDYLRDKRIEGILAGACLRDMAAEDGAQDVTEVSARVCEPAFVPSIPAGCKADDIIPGTDWTWGDALDAIAEREEDARRGNLHLYN